jgi:hypothetical protein
MRFEAKVYFNYQRCRALAVPDHSSVELIPENARNWIGSELVEERREFNTEERLVGFNPPHVWNDFQEKGYSAFEVKAEIRIAGGGQRPKPLDRFRARWRLWLGGLYAISKLGL